MYLTCVDFHGALRNKNTMIQKERQSGTVLCKRAHKLTIVWMDISEKAIIKEEIFLK